MNIWNMFLYQPLVNALIFLYQIFFHNFGLAIIVLTILIRIILVPLTLPSLKAAQKMRELGPELEKLKKKYANDKQALAKAQMELYKQHKINPAAGCLPQIIQLVVLIALYQAFVKVLLPNGQEVVMKLNEVLYPSLKLAAETKINTQFLWLNLAKPDIIRASGLPIPLPGIFLLASAIIQLFSSKMMAPATVAKKEGLPAQAGKKEEKTEDMTTMMSTQMTYLFPLMTIFIGYTFPSGLVLYWLVFSISTAIQQYLVSGWGGLEPWLKKTKLKS